MSLHPTDLRFYLSVQAAAGFEVKQPDVKASLGGQISLTPLTFTNVLNLFDAITVRENAARAVDYRCVFVLNAHATQTLYDAKVWIKTQQADGATISIGLDPNGNKAKDAAAQARTIPDETTAPEGVVFSEPTNKASGLALGDLAAGHCRALWIRRTATDSPAVLGHGVTLRVEGDNTTLWDGVLGFWRLDGDAEDAAGAFDLSANGTVGYVTGLLEQAADCSAGNLYFNDASSQMDLSDGFTIAGWVKLPATPDCTLLCYAGYGGATLRVESGFINGWQYDGSSWRQVQSGVSAPTDEWVFLCLRWDGSDELAITVNETTESVTGVSALYVLNPYFRISYEGWGYQSPGTFDEVGVWDRALDGEEVTALYNGGDGLTYGQSPPPPRTAVGNELPLRWDINAPRGSVYVAARTDGVFGCGSLSDPYNGSTAESFDRILRSLPPYTRIELAAGTYETRGYYDGAPTGYGWQLKPGQKIIGAGIDATVLRLTDAAVAGAHYFAIAHPLTVRADSAEVADLTIDCNLSELENVASGAVRLMGHRTRIRRVKAIDWGTDTNPSGCYVLSVMATSAAGTEAIGGTGIEDCIVVEPAPNLFRECVLLHVGGEGEVFGEAPFIRRCYVDGGASLSPYYHALAMSGCGGGVIEGNQVCNVRYAAGPLAYHTAQSVVIRENLFRNVSQGVSWERGGASAAPFGIGQVLVERNLIVLGDSAGISPWPSTGVRFTDNGASAPAQSLFAFGTVVIRGNVIRSLPGVESLAAEIEGAALLLMRDNFVENGLEDSFQNARCRAVRYFDNRATHGALLPGQDGELQDQYEALNDQAEGTVLLALRKR